MQNTPKLKLPKLKKIEDKKLFDVSKKFKYIPKDKAVSTNESFLSTFLYVLIPSSMGTSITFLSFHATIRSNFF